MKNLIFYILFILLSACSLFVPESEIYYCDVYEPVYNSIQSNDFILRGNIFSVMTPEYDSTFAGIRIGSYKTNTIYLQNLEIQFQYRTFLPTNFIVSISYTSNSKTNYFITNYLTNYQYYNLTKYYYLKNSGSNFTCQIKLSEITNLDYDQYLHFYFYSKINFSNVYLGYFGIIYK